MNNEKSKQQSKSNSKSEGKGKGKGVSFDDDLDSLDPSLVSDEEDESESNLIPTAENQSRSRQQSEQPLTPLRGETFNHRGSRKARSATQIDETHRPAAKQGATSAPDLSTYQSAGTEQDMETKRKKKLKSKGQPARGGTPSLTDFGDAVTLVSNDFTTEPREQTPNIQKENANISHVHDDNETLKKARPRRKPKEIHKQI